MFPDTPQYWGVTLIGYYKSGAPMLEVWGDSKIFFIFWKLLEDPPHESIEDLWDSTNKILIQSFLETIMNIYIYVIKIQFYKKVRDNMKILTLIIDCRLGKVLIVAVLVRRWEGAKKRCSMLICSYITLIYVMENVILLVDPSVIFLVWWISPTSRKVSRL